MSVLGRLAPPGEAPILDAPSGFGRNALALAEQGYNVVAVDKDLDRLGTLKHSAVWRGDRKASKVAGKVLTLCADLSADRLPFGESSFSAVICIHYPAQRIISDLKAALKRGGHLYIETFQGHGMNYLELPTAGEILSALQDCEILTYNERPVGPPSVRAVVVEALARKHPM